MEETLKILLIDQNVELDVTFEYFVDSIDDAEVFLDYDKNILLTDVNNKDVNMLELTKQDQKHIHNTIEEYLNNEQYENAGEYYRNALDAKADALYDSYSEGN
jgi:hypothetical protein